MSYISPYMHDVPEQNTKRGINIINTVIEFIEKKDLGKTLDIGERNPLTEILENYCAIKIENTNVDLDVENLSGKYDTIFCFEVIEHLYNPLHLLLEIHKILNDKGQLYLSTPKGKPHFLWFKHHFHEFYEPELRSLFIRAGFTIARLKYFRVIPIWKGFTGFRPFIRMIFQRKCIVELIK